MKICRGTNSQLVVSRQVVTTPCCGFAVVFCGFIPHLIGHETINIPDIFSGAHGFKGKIKTHNILQTGIFPQYPYTQSAVKCKIPTPSVGNQVENLFGILTSEFRVFFIYIYLFSNLFIFHAFRVLVILCSGFSIPAFRHSVFQ